MTSSLSEICNEIGVTIIQPRQQRQRGPGQTCAEGTLEGILRDEGAAHLRSILLTVMESENNRMALVRPVLLAISDILRAHPTWFGEKWLQVFDGIDLAAVHTEAKKHREIMGVHQIVAGMLLERLRPHFDEETQPRML